MSSSVFSGCQPSCSLRLGGRGHQVRRVAGAARLLADGDVDPGHGLRRLDDLAHGVAAARAEVDDVVVGRLDAVERQQVRAAEVLHVHVVADGGAVGRRVVRAEDRDRRCATGGGPQHERDQVRFGLVVLAVRAAGARHVEVAQRDRAEAVRAGRVGQHPVDDQLGLAVGVHRGGRRRLGDRDDRGLPVGRAGRGEDEPLDVRLAHRVEQVQRAHDVAAVVALGLRDGLGDERERREVQHAVEALGEHAPGGLEVEQVDVLEAHAVRNPRSVAAVERVEHGDVVAPVAELAGDDRTDIAGAAGDQDSHGQRD